jgi:LemA protein
MFVHSAPTIVAVSPVLVAAVAAGTAIAIVAIWLMAVYNGLVTRRVRVQNGFSQIDVQLRRRHDLVPNLVATVKGYMQHERSTLEAVTSARAAAINARSAVTANPGDAGATLALANAEGVLQAMLGQLMILMERYPDLKANNNALQLQEELVSTENRIAFARQAYNDAVMTFNTKLAVFPDVLVARLFSFTAAALFEADQSARALPNVDFGASASAETPRNTIDS